MLIDDSAFPIVFYREATHTPDPVEQFKAIDTQFKGLLDRNTPFVLITDHAPDDHEDETHEERKQKALFFKQIKVRLLKLCRGMIVIEGERPIGSVARLAASTASKAFGIAISFEANEQQAIKRAQELLTKTAA